MYPKEGGEKKKVSELSEQGQNVWVTGKMKGDAVSKGLVRGFGDETLRLWECLLPRLVQNVPDKHVFSQETKWSKMKLAASQAMQYNYHCRWFNSDES